MSVSRGLRKSTEGILLAAGAVVVFAALGLVLAALLPSHLGYESLIVYGGSMAPSLRLGDVAVIQRIRPEDLRVGDVVTYRSATNPQSLVTHRIADIKAEEGVLAFETKGDASPNVDYWSVTEDTVVGRVVYKVPFVGYVFNFAKGLPGRLLLVGLPALLLVVETSRGKPAHPSVDDRPISKVDDQTERQEVTPEAILAKVPAVLANHPDLPASSGGVAVQAGVVDRIGQPISSATGDHQEPLPSDPRRDYSPTSWLRPIELHPIEEKPPWLPALGRLLLRRATLSGRRNMPQSEEFRFLT